MTVDPAIARLLMGLVVSTITLWGLLFLVEYIDHED